VPGESLIVSGPYRYFSHPNYAVVVGEIALLPVALHLPWLALIFTTLNLAALAVRISVEMRALRTTGRPRISSPRSEPERRPDEDQVEVTLTKGFWMGKYEVTQGQWKRVIGKLPGELTVGGSNITIFQNWPYISIGLQNVKFYASKQTSEKPIYEAERMFVGFSLPDILKQKYWVKAIVLKNGRLQLIQDTAGRLNIVEASRIQTDSTPSAGNNSKQMDLNIKKFVLKNMDISYYDNQSRQRISSHIDRIQASFQLDSNSKVVADLKGALLVDFTRPGDTTLFRHKHLETDIQLSYDMPRKFLKLTEGKLKLDDPISMFRPDVPNGQNITIEELSEMRSGLFSYTFDRGFNETLDRNPTKAWTPNELLKIAFSHPNNFAPDAEYEYCNTNIALLGVVIQKLTGMSASAAFEHGSSSRWG